MVQTDNQVQALQRLQLHAYVILTLTRRRLKDVLSQEDLDGLNNLKLILEQGGEQSVWATAINDFAATRERMTPTLDSVDLAALNTVMSDLDYINGSMRSEDAVPPLPVGDQQPGMP